MILEKKEDIHIDVDSLPPELQDVADEAKKFMLTRTLYHSAIREVSTKLEILDDEFHAKQDYSPIHHMESRVKSIQSTFNKLVKKGYEFRDEDIRKITDIAGIRVICNYLDDVYTIRRLLLQQSDVELIREKDYIMHPKPSGYRSLHLIILVPVFQIDRVEKVPVEIQIRTIAMDTWASLEHELKYKRDGEISEADQTDLKLCAAQLSAVDVTMNRIHTGKKAIDNRD
ncbi:MAG: GTP pyrophosphokinase family protein [Anaerovoracaceae bacterium]|nr:GTP pyrophosphokinase family protein [Anaerovoracaceae bacterium]